MEETFVLTIMSNLTLRSAALEMLNNQNMWKYTTRRSNFHISRVNGLGKKINTGENASVFGHVYELRANHYNIPNGANADIVYVAKLMKFNNSTDRKIFMNEVNVGSNITNKSVGPRIYAYATTQMYGLYIMDHFQMGDPTLKMLSMSSYLKKYYPKSCPPEGSPVIQKAKATLQKFYTITRGYHGDLHTGNLYVIYRNGPRDIIKVLIFDYGAHTKFNRPLTRNACKSLNSLLTRINANFNSKKRKAGTNELNYFPAEMPVLYLQNKQPFRSNAKMLRMLNAQTSNRIVRTHNGYPLLK